jgi:hypothetical protein
MTETRLSASVLWMRALFAGSFAFFLGVAGHLMADGLLPGTAFLVVLYVFTVVLSVPVLARPGSQLRMLGLMVGGQTFIHLCLTLTAGHVGDPKVAAAPRPTGLGFTQLPTVDGHRVGSFQDAFAGSNAMPRTTPTLPIHHLVADMSAHASMMVVHLIAAALVALWLAYGEKCLLTVLAITARLILALVRPAQLVTVPVTLRSSLTEVAVVGVRSLEDLRRSVSRRGPPLLAG